MDMDDANVTRSGNPLVFDAFVKADSVINEGGYGRVMCSVSGGSDSDIVMDLVSRVDRDGKTRYVFFDTGLEYDATKRHISYLEERYGVGIERLRPRKPIPVCCREIGEPFISKHVSEQIHRLQSHGFRWEDEPFDTLYERYPRCRAALRWWSNDYDGVNGRESRFNIGLHRWLREFMVENPPDFRISNKCCDHAKKAVAADAIKRLDAELNITGIRKSEGGARSTAYKGCFQQRDGRADDYRPIFWFGKREKRDYETAYGIVHSDCYTRYGLDRTGCAGCPFGRFYLSELDTMRRFEPGLHKAACNIFGRSYEYTERYMAFKDRMDGKLRLW